MKLAALSLTSTPWWFRHWRRHGRDTDQLERRLDEHMAKMRTLTATLESQIHDLRGEADLDHERRR